MKNVQISVDEEYKIFDKLAHYAAGKPKIGPVGWVQVYFANKKIHEGPNLIVAKGREFVAQKIFESNVTDDGKTRLNYYDYKISHFGVGSGGATITGNDVTLTGPLIGDKCMYQPISLITGTGYLNDTASNYKDSAEDPLIHSYENSVKPISSHGGGIALEAVSYDNSPDYYTKVRCTCIIPPSEPTQLAAGGSVQISEAGLYMTNAALADTDANKVQMFAHICFPPKWKEKESAITIFWYILC